MKTIVAALFLVLSAGCASLWPFGDEPEPRTDLVIKTSPYSAGETLDRLAAAVEAGGGRVFARIDHAAGAQAVGEPLAPTQVLVFGNPRLGTPLIDDERTIGVELPARALAWEENGTTYLGYPAPADLARRHDISASAPAVSALAGALDDLTDVAVSRYGQ